VLAAYLTHARKTGGTARRGPGAAEALTCSTPARSASGPRRRASTSRNAAGCPPRSSRSTRLPGRSQASYVLTFLNRRIAPGARRPTGNVAGRAQGFG
jgi:hypothetical protein